MRVGVVCSVGVGAQRGGRARNEDNFLVCHDGGTTWRDGGVEHTEPARGEGVFVAVCDGMGGGEHGDVASTTAVRLLARVYASPAPRQLPRVLRRYVLECHRRLHDKAREGGPVRMGTTLTACWVTPGVASWVHVGDSRLYRFSGGALTCVTTDHTRAEFARRDGRPDVPQPDALAQCFIFGSRGLGDDASLRIEIDRDGGSFDARPGDRLLLCTDGLYGVVSDEAIASVLASEDDPQDVAESCLQRALRAGSTDNVTIVVVDVA